MNFDIDSLTVGDLEEIEKVAGPDATEMLMKGKVTAASVKAIVFVLGRRENPDFTIEDAANARFSEIDVPEDPTEAAG